MLAMPKTVLSLSSIVDFGPDNKGKSPLAESCSAVYSSNLTISGNTPAPEPLDGKGIQTFIKDYVQRAKNAIHARFEGVEIHEANGYTL